MDEQMILAAAMLNPQARDVLLMLGEDDFTTHANRTIAAAIRDMHRRGDDIDSATVAEALESRGELSQCGGRIGLYEMCSALPTATNAEFYAHRVRQATRLRMMQATTERMRESLTTEQAIGGIDELVRWRTESEAKIPGPLEADDLEGDTVDALLRRRFPPDVWLLPGRLLRGDRLVITGGEGAGKAWMMRQIVACAAAGMDPFTGESFGDGYRVLVLDAENGAKEMQESFARLDSVLPDNGWRSRVFAFDREAGMDLTRADLGWLHRKAAAISPDLIAIGPVYKIMFGRDPRDERDTLALLTALDDVRVRHRAAMILEHHAPHGNGVSERSTRPAGSSYWMRWATIGLGLKAHDMRDMGFDKPWGEPGWKNRPEYLDVERWRFMRGSKRWPHMLRKGGPADLPWVAYEDDQPTTRGRVA